MLNHPAGHPRYPAVLPLTPSVARIDPGIPAQPVDHPFPDRDAASGWCAEAGPGLGSVAGPGLGGIRLGGVRGQIMDGCLLVAPADSRRHERIVANLTEVWIRLLPAGPETLANTPVRLAGGDCVVPDLLVTTAGESWDATGLPVPAVHTVVEVVSPHTATLDRVRKPELYALVGIPCYWRVEPDAWRGYRGRLPIVVVRYRDGTGWQTLIAPAGREARLPVAVSADRMVWIPLDPVILATPRSGTVPGEVLLDG